MGVLMEAAEAHVARDAQPAVTGAYVSGYTIEARDSDFGKIVEPIPLRLYRAPPAVADLPNLQQFPCGSRKNGVVLAKNAPGGAKLPASATSEIAQKVRHSESPRPPPKKKWIKEYLEEEPPSPLTVTVVGGVLPISLPPRPNGLVLAPSLQPAPAASAPTPLQSADFVFEHSRPHSNSYGPSIPSPPASSRDAAGGIRAGTREVHNKLEKNRRAHLKECFELLKRQLPAASDDKKASNLSILASANRYIQVLRRKERECEHEMERLAREKIASQQRLAALKREVSLRSQHAPCRPDEAPTSEESRDERVNGHLLGVPISITSAGSACRRSPTATALVTTAAELRTTPLQISTSQQNGQTGERGLSPAMGTALVHPAHLHLPLSQVVRGGLVVGGGALQLVSGPAGALRVLHASHIGHGATGGGATARLPIENGIVTSSASAEAGGVVVSGLGPLVVSQAQLLDPHKVMSAQYLGATLVNPLVVVSSAPAPPPAPSQPPTSSAPV